MQIFYYHHHHHVSNTGENLFSFFFILLFLLCLLLFVFIFSYLYLVKVICCFFLHNLLLSNSVVSSPPANPTFLTPLGLFSIFLSSFVFVWYSLSPMSWGKTNKHTHTHLKHLVLVFMRWGYCVFRALQPKKQPKEINF